MGSTNKHIIQFDGLRFFAVLMVMVAHWLQWQWKDPVLTKIPFSHGVTLFFVLSGFLITRILLVNRDKYNSKDENKFVLIKNFYTRRFFRIFPIYYLLLFFLFAIDFKNTRELFPWLITYTSNIYQSINNIYIGDFNHFWSLAVEEQFYLFWPFVILFIKPNKTFLAIILTIILAIFVRAYLYFFIDKWVATAFFTLSCMHALGLGAFLAYVKLYKPKIGTFLSKPLWLYLAAGIYVCTLTLQYTLELDWFKQIFDDFLFAIVATLIILKASEDGFKGITKYILEHKFITYLGKISYGMYVFHLFMPALYYYIAPKLGLSIYNKYALFIAFFVLNLIVSYFSWKLIESPINKLKDKFPYMRVNK